MNISDIKVTKNSVFTTLHYSFDDGYTRYVVIIYNDGTYNTKVNESTCFNRRTHLDMARSLGHDLVTMDKIF